MRKLYVMLLAVALVFSCFVVNGAERKKKKSKTVQSDSVKNAKSKYEELTTKAGVEAVKGEFLSFYRDGDKMYVEFPLKYMGREVLLGGTVSKVSDPEFVNVGYKYNDPLHLRVLLKDSIVVFERPTYSAVCTSNSPEMKEAYDKNYMPQEYKRFPRKMYNSDSTAVVFDATELFMNPDVYPYGNMGFIVIGEGKLKPYFGAVKSFDDNVSVIVNQQAKASINLFLFTVDLSSMAIQTTVSMVLLPEEKMKPRIQDSRVGVFPTFGHDMLATPKRDLAQLEDGMKTFVLANRWKLEPKDERAWERGELVEPKKPIVWYVDNTFPTEWREPIKKGVLRWNAAFEKIGFKNVMQVKDFPVDDPTFDPDNLKYTCLRYSPSPVANAMGPSWVDPTTGEILNASVIIYNDIVKLNNKWRFIQTAQVDPRVRAKVMPRDVMDESIEYVVAHEIGHTLGLMHNMAASNAYPVDSLRSASFTRKYGTTPSIMDYARYNYVVQPGDNGVKLTPPDLGMYDEYVIKWLYTPIPEAKDMWEEAEIAERWIDEKAGDIRFRYGRQQVTQRYDPTSLEEDLGDDPIKASNYGIKNLKYILANMNEWIDEKGEVSHRSGLYIETINQYYRYMMNVLFQVGGMRLSQVKEGTSFLHPVDVLPRDVQKASLSWILREMKESSWIDAPELTKNFDLSTSASSWIVTNMMRGLMSVIPANITLASHIDKDKDVYTIQNYFDDLYAGIFAPTIQGRKLTEKERMCQRLMMETVAKEVSKNKEGSSYFAGGKALPTNMTSLPSLADMEAYGLGQQNIIKAYREQLQELEDRFGCGMVASIGLSSQFGENAYPLQRKVKIDDISEIMLQKTYMLKRIQGLLKSKLNSVNKDDRAHYEYILIRIENALK